jgi:hypothetical protein
MLIISSPAFAVSVSDNYYGGLNTYNDPNDVIGGSDFQISGADVTRSGNNLKIKVYTNFVQHIGEDGVGLGSLFLSNVAPNYNVTTYNAGSGTYSSTGGATSPYSEDTFAADPGRFQYAAVIPTNPSGTSGTGNVYALSGTGKDVILSNVYNDQVTHGFSGGDANYYFRQGQAVGVDTSGKTAVSSVSYTIGSDSLTFTIDNAFDFLNDGFYFAWEMTCANDVLLAQVPPNVPGLQAPIPASLPLFVSGLGLLGYFGMKRRRKATVAAG